MHHAVEARPPAATQAIARRVGQGATWQVLRDNGTTVTWRATGPRGSWVLHIGYRYAAPMVSREAQVLHELRCHRAVAYGGLAHGRQDRLSWLARPWLPGITTWEALQPLRECAPGWRQAITAAVALCTTVGTLHDAGWVHAGIQPNHAVHHHDGAVRLLSCSGAWSPSFLPGVHSGGLVHLQAPEHVARILAGQPAMVTPAAEVYSLAATLWRAAAGRWHLDYERIGIDPDRCTPDVLRAMRHRVPLTDTIPRWPQLTTILKDVLQRPEQSRPSAHQLAADLHDLVRQ